MNTLRERINQAQSMDTDINRLIMMAYYVGCHDGVKRVCDKHSVILANMRKRADACRYHILANSVIGSRNNDTIYDGDYSSDFPYWEMEGDYPHKY
ncbi:MAG: hypothetical protein WC479_09245 [Candidatus Izemoplasmatales bacterium]|jgi:hypothetical protein